MSDRTIYITDQANMRFQVFRYLKNADSPREGEVLPVPAK